MSPSPAQAVSLGDARLQRIEAMIAEVGAALGSAQKDDGHWRFTLEADATIPAEYILLNHYLDEIDPAVESRLAGYIRDCQGEDGGWPLFFGAAMDLSCSVKAYFALKMVGDSPEDAHMRRARDAILAKGGAARSNVFTRVTLALFGQVPWRAVPSMPVEIMLLPRWFPFHLSKISYWSRTVIVPLLILMAHRPRARNPRRVDVRELFSTPPDRERHYFANRGWVAGAFLLLDRVLRAAEPWFPKQARARAIAAAVGFITERLNGIDGLGGIFPAMANALMAFDLLGYPRDHPDRAICRKAIDGLLVFEGGADICQPCHSPVWDTGLAAHAAIEAEGETSPQARHAADWLLSRQILDGPADWRASRPDLAAGGWAFQYNNPHYPDVDDTAVAVMLLDRLDDPRYRHAVERGLTWIEGMQSQNGGWGAFDADNSYSTLNYIPFADHGALLDPPTADVTARCIGALCQAGRGRDHPTVARALAFLRAEQEADGAWFGRWGTNYIYGTWSVLNAFTAAGEDPRAPHIRRAVAWLRSCQRPDGGWGEDGVSYFSPEQKGVGKASTPSQTAWAVLGLMAAGEIDSFAVRRGIDYLLSAPRQGARWDENYYTAVGFPRVFYLRYHGYAAYFPLWALARYRNLLVANARTTSYGI